MDSLDMAFDNNIVTRLIKAARDDESQKTLLLKAVSEIVGLRCELAKNVDEVHKMLTELERRIKTLTTERDEARRELCEWASLCREWGKKDPKAVAQENGWTCFDNMKEF